MYLSSEDFKSVIKNTPLVSIDLIIKSGDEYLLGKRVNNPAKDSYFVLGGRIQKDETKAKAYRRVSQSEFGITLDIDDATLLGVYEHFYGDNFFDDSFSTHYVAIAYIVEVDKKLIKYPPNQHNDYVWYDKEEIMSNQSVHNYTKDYFKDI